MNDELRKVLRVSIALAVGALLGLIVLAGPGCTIAPKVLPPQTTPTVSVVELPDGSKRIPDVARDRYNWLIAHGWGGASHHIIPPLKKDDGVRPDGPGWWVIDRYHAGLFAQMDLTFKSSLKQP